VSIGTDAARRHVYRACALGGAVGAVGFTWMLAIGRLDLLHEGLLSGLYDAQAHRLLEGHWDVPVSKLAFEAFLIDGKTYMYHGPWPAFLRLPIAAVTDRLDGRLTQLSMLAAFVVLLAGTSRLMWRVRELACSDRPVARLERWAIAIFVLVVAAGSVVMFLAGRPVIYHEVELWGAALAVAAYSAILDFVVRASRRALAWAGVLSGLALLSRGSVGIGPIIALGLVLLGRLVTMVAGRLRRPALERPVRWLGLGDEHANRGYLVPLVVAIAVPVVFYMYVNWVKFGHPWNLPITRQLATFTDPVRKDVFAHNGGKLFSFKFVPTNVVAMLRPDALGLDRLVPWVTFPAPATLVGSAKFAVRDPSSSIPASMPLLFVLSVVGLVAVFRPRHDPETRLAALRVPVLGGFAGGIGAITIPFINQRYISDFLPLLVLLAAAGLHALLRRAETRSTTKAVTRAAVVGFALLAAASLWVNFGLAILYQREYSPFATESERAAFVRFQYDFDPKLPGRTSPAVRAGARLPGALPSGTLFVVGRCDGVYWSDGKAWQPVERTPATGHFPLKVAFRKQPAGTRETLLTAGPAEWPDRVGVEYLSGDRVRVWFSSPGLTRDVTGPAHTIEPGHPTNLEIDYDAALANLGVQLDGESVLGSTYPLNPGPITVAGTPDGRGTLDFSGMARLEPASRRFCEQVAPRAARAS
jgi:hypothetical protein